MTLRLLLSAALAAAVALTAGAVDTADGVFHSAFKSLRSYVDEAPLAPPVLILNSSDRLVIEFDELAEDASYLRYRLVHCNADWTPSQLVDSEYLDGFNEAQVTHWQLSQSTLTHYVHYTITIPNADMAPTLSGNYLLQVYSEDDPDEVLLQTRFMISENAAPLSASVTSRTDVDYNRSHHQLAVSADLDGAAVADPFNDLRLVVIQNGRPDTRRVLDKPLRLGADRAIYEHQPALIFPAGNEYRRFETATVKFPGMGVDHYVYADPFYHAVLSTDLPRPADSYQYDQDQSGRFFPVEYNSQVPEIEADYVVTHFRLEMPQMPDAEIYLDGDMVNRRLDSDSRMVYVPAEGAYIKTMLLKQGHYNYQYLTSRPGARPATAPIEGDHYETVNDYLILLYHTPPMARAQRLIGATVISSGR